MSSANPIRQPESFTGPIADAHAMARERLEPIFVPATFHVDDRGYSLMNLLTGVLSPEGQVNYSVQHPNVIKAWHRHHKQTDFWLPLKGHLKVGVYREDDDRRWMMVLGERRPGIMVIPPPLWHGAATVGSTPAGLLYFVTHQYDPANPDEDRRGFDTVAGFPWTTDHR